MLPGKDPAQVPTAPEAAAPAPEPDYWEHRGHTIIRHIRTPRTKLFRPTDDVLSIPIPVDQIDVTRDIETTSTFQGEGNFRDVWDGVSAEDHPDLSEPWTGLIRFCNIPEYTPNGKVIVQS